MLLAQWLKQRRLQNGLTTQNLADLLNVPQSLISKVENSLRRLDVIEFIDYCRALGVDPCQAFLYLNQQNYLRNISFLPKKK